MSTDKRTATTTSLPTLKIVAGAVALLLQRYPLFLRALAPLVLAMLAIELLPYLLGLHQSMAVALLALAARLALFTLFAVRCHRLTLEGADALAGQRGPLGRWSARETQYLGNFFTVYFTLILGATLLMTFIGLPLVLMFSDVAIGPPGEPEREQQMAVAIQQLTEESGWVLFAVMLLGGYFLGRLCCVFPAAALGLKLRLADSWRMTAGNGWQLFLLVGLLPLLFGALGLLLLREQATLVEVLLVGLLRYLLLAVELVVLSLAYNELRRTP